MDGITIFLISFAALIFMVIVFAIILFIMKIKRIRKGVIIANFVYDDRTIERFKYYAVVDVVEFKELTYDYNDNLTIKRKGVKNIFYNVGNKNPIDFKNPTNHAMNYSDYKKIIKSKILNELLTEENSGFSSIDKLLLIAIIGSAVLVVMIMVYLLGQPSEVVLSSALKEFVKEAVIEAIKG